MVIPDIYFGGPSFPGSVMDESPEHHAGKLGMETARLSPHIPTSVALMQLLDDARIINAMSVYLNHA